MINNNFKNIINNYDKISYFNKNNLSKLTDFKISRIKKVSMTLSKIKNDLNNKSESEDEKE